MGGIVVGVVGVRGGGIERKVEVEGAGEVVVVWVVRMGGAAPTPTGRANVPGCCTPSRQNLGSRVREYDSDILMPVLKTQYLSYYGATVLWTSSVYLFFCVFLRGLAWLIAG